MGLGHLNADDINLNSPGARAIFNNTWGHYAPEKNTSYKGIVRFTLTNHSHYGCQPIIIQYEFPNLEGPYIHDALFNDVHEWDYERFEKGAVYEVALTFRNYRWYYGKVIKVSDPIKLNFN